MNEKNVCTAGCDKPQRETLCDIARESLEQLWEAMTILRQIHGIAREDEAEEDEKPCGAINLLEEQLGSIQFCSCRIRLDLQEIKCRIGP